MEITFSRHAADMLAERSISRDWVERTLGDPQSTEPDPGRPGQCHAFREIEECDGRVLRVVYVPGERPHVVTLFFDRARTRRNAKSLRR